jgi:hypothetical protein
VVADALSRRTPEVVDSPTDFSDLPPLVDDPEDEMPTLVGEGEENEDNLTLVATISRNIICRSTRRYGSDQGGVCDHSFSGFL